ncbi:hypothetical protein J2X69_000123 [Algoriphagus sp. 4150]|nr:hypothetical protein [Algoriphagus sp. 4150]
MEFGFFTAEFAECYAESSEVILDFRDSSCPASPEAGLYYYFRRCSCHEQFYIYYFIFAKYFSAIL